MSVRRATAGSRRRCASAGCAALLSALAVALPFAAASAQHVERPAQRPGVLRDGPTAAGVFDLPRLAGAIRLDGVLDEPAWAAIEPLPLTMYEPTYRGASERRIELRVAYDDEALYVAAAFYHDDPRAIRAFTLTRDRWSGDDGFGILLDTFNDKQNAVRFVGLPLGAKMDMAITGDGQQEAGSALGPRNIAWNTFWDLETRIADDGWYGEMRIPFSSLRFTAQPDGSVRMGMMVYAYEPAHGSRWTFPAIPAQFPYTQVSAWQEIRLHGITPRNPVYLSPYGLAGTARTTALNGDASAYVGATRRNTEFGADLKLNPTPNLTLDLTANTDFAAVEADQQQVNLTRFSLFFEEKRPFFQERAGIFSFETGAETGTLFYSRRIGLAEGRPVRILGGARLVGRVAGWDFGLIGMQTGRLGELAPENFGVLRVQRGVLNANSLVGAMATSRISNGGRYNVTYGLDGLFRVTGNEYLTVKWLQTFQRLPSTGDVASAGDAAATGIDAGRVVADWTRRQLQGLSYRHALTWSGPGYEPGIGFEPRRDFTRLQSDGGYQWYPGESSRFRRIWVGSEGSVWRRNADNRVDTGRFRPFVQLETKPGTTLILAATTLYDDVPLAFQLGADAEIPAGSYYATEAAAEFRAPRGWAFRPNLALRGGEFFDGTRLGVESSMSWSLNRHLELGGGWEWNRIRFAERDQRFDANLLRIRAQGAVDTRLSMNALVQYNSLLDLVSTNARVRYNFREGQDLWFVWNEALNTELDAAGLPRRPLSEARTLTIKYTHTLVF